MVDFTKKHFFLVKASGAYIFRPNGTHSIKSDNKVTGILWKYLTWANLLHGIRNYGVLKFQAPFTVFRGPLLDEVHQRINSWIYQVVYPKRQIINLSLFNAFLHLLQHQNNILGKTVLMNKKANTPLKDNKKSV